MSNHESNETWNTNSDIDKDTYPPFQDIPRRSPKIPVELGGKSLELTWYNCQIRIYRAPYGDMNHLQIGDRVNGYMRVFGTDEPAQSLMNDGFTVIYASEPDPLVLKHYVEMMTDRLPDDLSDNME